MPRSKPLVWSLIAALVVVAALRAKEPAPQVLVWPSAGQPVVRITLSRIKEISSAGKQRTYSIDITAQNLWSKRIERAQFSLYLFDKDKSRIGEGWISIGDVAPGEVIKFQMDATASGIPVSMTLAPQSLPSELQSYLPSKTVSVTVNSVPQGAVLKVDGLEAGTTPKIVRVTPGKHILEFAKEGFNPGHYPLEVSADDLSGGSVSYELGTSAHDTVELRDGSILVGDVESMSPSEVLLHIGGATQHLDRNNVKRISLVQRETPPQ